MIISDHHQFAFIHIPKCAGTTVRSTLQTYDDKDGAFTNRVDNHPDLGRIDYVHIPLIILEHFFPAEFNNLQTYWSFAILRDPFTRFASSVAQRLKMYTEQPIDKRPLKEIQKFTDQTITALLQTSWNQMLLPPEYIHFQPQVDYVYCKNERIPKTLYTMDHLSALFSDVNKYIGLDLFDRTSKPAENANNQTRIFRNELLRVTINTARPATTVVSSFLPHSARQIIRNCVYVPQSQRTTPILKSKYVTDFIRDFYSKDIVLYEETRNSGRGTES